MSLRYLFISFLGLCLLAGCSGGGGGGDSSFAESPANTQIVAGFVEDGPITGSTVSLRDPTTGDVARRCWSSGVGRCETTTDDQGHFLLHLATGVDPSAYRVVSEAGQDHLTGISYEEMGIDLSAPFAAFQNDQSRVNVSPLTTLLDELVRSGKTLDWSLQRLASWSGMASQEQLLAQPSQSAPLLKRTLLVVALILELKENGATDAWEDLRLHIDSGKQLIDSKGDLDPAQLQADFLFSASQAANLAALGPQLAVTLSASQLYDLFNRHLVATLLAVELDDFLATKDPANFSATDPAYQANGAELFATISDAAGSAIPLWNWTPQKILQHVLFKYQLTDFASFQVPTRHAFIAGLTRSEDGDLIALGQDSRIVEIATGQPPHLVNHALAADELLLPANNLRRVGYYYNSDISHLRYADDLASAVLDDQLNDELLVKLVKGTARAGMVEGWVDEGFFPADLTQLIENRIFSSEFRGKAYVAFAEAASDWDFFNDSLLALDEADQSFRNVLNAKGTAFFATSDATNFRELATAYLHAGDFASAFNLLQFLHTSIAAPINTNKSYSHAFSAGLSLADEAIAQGDFALAGTVIDEMKMIALATPADISKSGIATYKTRIFHLVETAWRYALIGEFQNALDLYYANSMIEDLRVNDGLMSGDGTYKNRTGSSTGIYMDEMAQALYRAGDEVGAFGLLDTLSSSSRARGYKDLASMIALQEAAQGGLLPPQPTPPAVGNMSALDLIYYQIPTDTFNKTALEVQVDGLTYFVASRAVPYIALTLIENGFDAAADDALTRATDLVRQMSDNLAKPFNLGNAKIDFGFVKIAGLYVDIGMDQTARSLLLEAETQVLPNVLDAGLVNKSLAKMADVYLRLGDASKASSLLAQASASLSLDSYEDLIEALLRVQAASTMDQIADYVALAQSFYIPGATADGDLEDIVTHLIKAADFYSAAGDQVRALQTLALVQAPAMEIVVPADRVTKLKQWAAGYAKIGEFATSLQTVRLVENEGGRVSRNEAFLDIGTVYAEHDDFDSDVASVDLDKDGRPDFFHPLATAAEIQASGLILDDDIDGDGLLDEVDTRPMYFDSVQ